MTDLRILIACGDPDLRKLVYTLLPGANPLLLRGDLQNIDALIRANSRGDIDTVIIDSAFQREGGRDRIADLAKTNLPIVALLPRYPTYTMPATAPYAKAARDAGAVGLDIPTTVAGLEMALKRAIDNREQPQVKRGPDYGREASWPRLRDPVEGASAQFAEDQKTRDMASKLKPPGLHVAEDMETRDMAHNLKPPSNLASGLKPAGAHVAHPWNTITETKDEIDTVIEAAKAIVVETNKRVIRRDPDNYRAWVACDLSLITDLTKALSNAGYGP